MSEWLGLDSEDDNNILNNMGIMIVIAIAILLVIILLAVVTLLTSTNYLWYRRLRLFHNMIYYNLFLRYIL
jgi:hypothetical protein